jgi:hypothetical protein
MNIAPRRLVPKGTVRRRERVNGRSPAGIILPPGVAAATALPVEHEEDDREGHSTDIVIAMGTDETVIHAFDFLHPGRAPAISLALTGLYICGRTKDAKKEHEEGEAGGEQASADVFLTVLWPPGHTHDNARNEAVLFQTIEKGNVSGNYEEWEEVGPGAWGLETWFGSLTTADHTKLTLTTERLGGAAEVDSVNVHIRVTETWNAKPAPPPVEASGTTGTIAIGSSVRGVVDKQQALVR